MNDLMKICCLVLYWTICVTAGIQEDLIEAGLGKGRGSRVLQQKARVEPVKIEETRQYEFMPAPGENGLPSSNTELFIQQNINNFEYTSDEKKKFIQRFIINADKFNENGIVILIIGDQKQIDTNELKKEVWKQYAEDLNALLIHVEHRFWGISCPKNSFTNKNLVYLNSEQALADFAILIETFKIKYWGVPKTAKWIAFGSGRSGTLAARLRLKYPHLIQGAVSASSPLKETPNYDEFFDNFTSEFGEAAKTQIYSARIWLDNVLKKGKIQKLKNKFNMCDTLDVDNNETKNVQYFVWTIFTFLGALIEEKNYERKGFYEFKTKIIKDMVSKIPEIGFELDRFPSSIKKIFDYFRDNTDRYKTNPRPECLQINYNEAVALYRDVSSDAIRRLHVQLNVGIGDRQAFFQQCIEFGQFRTSDIRNFLTTEVTLLGFYTDFCQDVFGNGFQFINEALDRTTFFYGGKDIRAKRVIFVNRKPDPSSKLYITKSTTNEVVVYNEKVACCDDVQANAVVPKNLFYSQRNNIIIKLKEWLIQRVEV